MAAQPQQNQGDNSMAFLWITVAVIVAGGLIWYFAHAYIVAFVLKIRLGEAYLVSMVTGGLASQIVWIKTVNPADVTFKELSIVSTQVGDYLRYPFVFIIALCAFVIYFKNVSLKFRKTYSMSKLAHDEVVNWPQITPVIDLDLLKENIDEGPWAMAQSPMLFAKYHKLLKEEKVDHTEAFWLQGKPKVVVKREEAAKVFTLQMGRHWEGLEGIPIHVQTLFAIFAARIAGDRDVTSTLLTQQIAKSTKTGKLDFTGSRELLMKHYQDKKVIKVQQGHAYLLTVMAGMIDAARDDGVLATSEFLWLKPLDRPLWYMLSSVGRQTSFPEVSGPFAHWKAEKVMRRRIMVPMIEEAVIGLELAIKDIIYIPDDEENDDVLQSATG